MADTDDPLGIYLSAVPGQIPFHIPNLNLTTPVDRGMARSIVDLLARSMPPVAPR
jgi:hypothetical protein